MLSVKSKFNIYELFIAFSLFVFAIFALNNNDLAIKILVPFVNFNPIYLHLIGTVLLCLIFVGFKFIKEGSSRFDIVSALLLLQCVLDLLPVTRPDFVVTGFLGHYLNTVIRFIMYFIFSNSNVNVKRVVKYFAFFGVFLTIQVIWTAILIDVPFSNVVFKNSMHIPFNSSNMISAILIPIVFMIKRSNLNQISKISVIGFLIVGIVLCRSRGALLILGIMIFIEIVNFILKKKNKVVYISILLFLIVLIICLVLYVPTVRHFLLGYIADDEFTFDGLTSGRLSIYKEQLKIAIQNPIFGTGLFYDATAPSGAHNLFIDLLSKCGIVGLVVYTSALYFVFKKPSNQRINTYKYEILPLYIFIFILLLYSMIEVCYFNYKSDVIFWMIAGILQSKKQICKYDDLYGGLTTIKMN